MRKEFRDIVAGGQTYRVTWDMYAVHLLEKIGAPSSLEIIHTAIVTAAANDDQPAPISVQRLGILFGSKQEQDAALDIVTEVATTNGHISKESASGKAAGETGQNSSGDSTSSPPSTLELASASSGA